MATGRPSWDYDPDIAEQICNEIAHSDKGLATICESNEDWPSRRTITKWILENEQFALNYARAKELQAEFLADQIVDIADTPRGEGTRDEVERSKLMVDARKWVAGKLLPKKYGERNVTEHTGAVMHVVSVGSVLDRPAADVKRPELEAGE